MNSVLLSYSVIGVACVFQADQRFVWNGNLLRDLAAQPEVTHVTVAMVHLFFNHACVFSYSNVFN